VYRCHGHAAAELPRVSPAPPSRQAPGLCGRYAVCALGRRLPSVVVVDALHKDEATPRSGAAFFHHIPAVVHIEVTERQEVANPFLPLESNPLLRRFFHIPRLPEKVTREFMGLGTRILM
jgi:hypothetical protein